MRSAVVMHVPEWRAEPVPDQGGQVEGRVLLQVSAPRWTRSGPPTVGPAPRLRITLRGEMCPVTVDEVGPALALAAALTTDLDLDIDEVTLLSAAALSLFVVLDGHLATRSGGLVLRRPDPTAWRVLRACGLEWLVGPPTEAPRARRSALAYCPAETW